MEETGKVNINIDPEKIESKYSDAAFINMNAFGITLDFGQQLPQLNSLKIFDRISMSPQHAKVFSQILVENIKQYEERFGKIEISQQARKEAQEIGFKFDPDKNS
jgi:hypothetical protein